MPVDAARLSRPAVVHDSRGMMARFGDSMYPNSVNVAA
jgi:hypothetical protein